MSQALIIYGGWVGHQPREVARLFEHLLTDDGFAVRMADSFSVLDDPAAPAGADLIVPVWTMGKITSAQSRNIRDAVAAGVGVAGCHGGMCDALREDADWQFMTGGQFVGHPGGMITYTVRITDREHPVMRDIGDFAVTTEQYYMHVDPAIKVLAVTRFPSRGADGPHAANGPVDVPVIWTKMWGRGRVFYSSIGHDEPTVAAEPHRTIMRRGFKWATRPELR